MMTHLPPSLSVKVHFSTVSGAPLVIVVWDESHPIQLIALSVPRSWYGPRWYKIAYGGLWWCQTRPAIRSPSSPTGSQIGLICLNRVPNLLTRSKADVLFRPALHTPCSLSWVQGMFWLIFFVVQMFYVGQYILYVSMSMCPMYA